MNDGDLYEEKEEEPARDDLFIQTENSPEKVFLCSFLIDWSRMAGEIYVIFP